MRIKIVLSYCFLFILFSENFGLAQKAEEIYPQPIFRQFTVDQGLPSNEVYHIIQDSIGYIWIATANGVSRFDGNQFVNYGIDEGLVESTVNEIFIDYKSRLWFISSSGRLSFMEDNQIKQYKYNHRINEYVPKARGPVKKSFFVDSLDNVFLSLKGFGQIEISADGVVTLLKGIENADHILIEKKSNISHLFTTKVKVASDNIIRIIYQGTDYDITGPKTLSYFHFMTFEENDNSIVFNTGGIISRVKEGKIIQSRGFESEIIWIGLDKFNNIWISLLEGGILFCEGGDFYNSQNTLILKDQKISSHLHDNEGGYWFSSLNSGIFYCPNINIIAYNEENGLSNNRINTVFANREGVFTGDEFGVLSHIKGNSIKKYVFENDSLGFLPIRFIGIDSTSTQVWIGSSVHLHLLENGLVRTFLFRTYFSGSFPRQIIPTKDGYWLATSWGIRKFNGHNFTYSSRESKEFVNTVFSVFEDFQGVLWMATANGVWRFVNNTFEYMGNQNPYFAHSTNYIAGTKNNLLLFATKGIGLVYSDGKTVARISQNDGIASNFINKIFVSPDGIWIATNNGLSWITGDITSHYQIKNITTSHGLPTNEINNVFVRGSLLYVATTKGLALLNIHQIDQNTVKPNTTITELRASGTVLDASSNNIKLTYKQNFLSIGYIGLAYKNMGRVQYRYRLTGLDTTWTYSHNTSAIFTNLPSKKFCFEVQAQNSDGLWGDSAKVSFSISAPYWQTYWFIIISTLMFSLSIFFVFRLRIKELNRRNQLLNNLNIYKQKSLRQQMNPHFIFNTLNSIQLYILEKDHISSHKYLTKFSKLMRLVLDNSQQSSVELSKEIDALRLYLELESIRLSGKFEYQINIESDELLSHKVPTLLIQPFVENAIWHGIMLKPDQDGVVSISVSNRNDSLLCTIEDNGIGRKAAQEIRQKQDAERKSLGFKITAQRIDLLNSLYKDRFNIKYIDLVDDQGQVRGTRVEILIPFNLKEEVDNQ